MTSTSVRRDEVLAAVIAEVDRRLDGEMPMDLPGVTQVFRTPAELARVLDVRWQASLVAQVEDALAQLPDKRPKAVVRAWRRTARNLPGTRMVLDRHVAAAEGEEAQRWARVRDRQRQWLATRAGLATESRVLDPEAVAAGAELEAEGRRYFDPRRRTASPTLLQRLKAVVAA